ncbi:MAG: fibronectin-binding autotransporter adhesin, partial [Verrucomicrobiota bacterium]
MERMKLVTGKLTGVLFSAMVLAVTSFSAQAAVLTVTNTDDSGAGSLRDTIAAAANGDTVQFDPALSGQAITLTSAELLIDKDLAIAGPGANKLTVQRSTAAGTPAFRIFRMAPSNFQFPSSVTLAGLTIANGNTPEGGGGINFYGGELTIANCVVSGNSAEYGGGVFGSSGPGSPRVSITNSVISGNSAAYGGGIYIHFIAGSYTLQPGRLAMTNST